MGLPMFKYWVPSEPDRRLAWSSSRGAPLRGCSRRFADCELRAAIVALFPKAFGSEEPSSCSRSLYRMGLVVVTKAAPPMRAMIVDLGLGLDYARSESPRNISHVPSLPLFF